MKYLKSLPVLAIAAFYLLYTASYSSAQSVGINDAGSAPDKSALLDLSASDRGFLITRADTANIISPAFGLMTLAPKDSCLYIYSGTAWMGMGGGGSDCICNCSDETPSVITCDPDNVTTVNDITSTNGKVWMDRNLGASRVATSSNDTQAYGDLYQWGRCFDGHEKRNSGTNTTQSTTSMPAHGEFILPGLNISNWLNPANDDLWQGVAGVNNPCPAGYRLPTMIELEDEMNDWSSNNVAGGFNSPLKLTAGGFRANSNGNIIYSVNLSSGSTPTGHYWSSTIGATLSRFLQTYNTVASRNVNNRAQGKSIRCIKD